MDRLVDFLQENGETRGFTNYWVAYPLAFRSGEELIFIPRLPYHEDLRYTTRDDRYPAYSRMVNEAQRLAYITTRHPILNERIREGLAVQGIEYRETDLGDYHIFYRLSRLVTPEELGIYD
jgi:hypothetical protein